MSLLATLSKYFLSRVAFCLALLSVAFVSAYTFASSSTLFAKKVNDNWYKLTNPKRIANNLISPLFCILLLLIIVCQGF